MLTVEEVYHDFRDWLYDGNEGVPWHYPTINGMACTHIRLLGDNLYELHTVGRRSVYAVFTLTGQVRIAEPSTLPDPYAKYRSKNQR